MKIKEAVFGNKEERFKLLVGATHRYNKEGVTVESMKYNRLLRHVVVKWSDGDTFILTDVKLVVK